MSQCHDYCKPNFHTCLREIENERIFCNWQMLKTVFAASSALKINWIPKSYFWPIDMAKIVLWDYLALCYCQCN